MSALPGAADSGLMTDRSQAYNLLDAVVFEDTVVTGSGSHNALVYGFVDDVRLHRCTFEDVCAAIHLLRPACRGVSPPRPLAYASLRAHSRSLTVRSSIRCRRRSLSNSIQSPSAPLRWPPSRASRLLPICGLHALRSAVPLRVLRNRSCASVA